MTAAYGKWQWGKGTYSAPIDLAGALAPAMTFSATMAFPNMLSGDMPVAVSIGSALLSEFINLTGGLVPQIALSGYLGTDLTLVGDLPITVAIAAQMLSGPQWASIEPCAPVDWEEAVLCNG